MLWKVLKAFKSAKCYFNISPPSSLPSLLRLSLPPSHCKKWKTSLSLETCTISLFMRYLVTLPPTIVLNFDSWRKFLTYIKLYVYISIKWPVVNYSKLDFHTNTVISHAFAYSSRWCRNPWRGPFRIHLISVIVPWTWTEFLFFPGDPTKYKLNQKDNSRCE